MFCYITFRFFLACESRAGTRPIIDGARTHKIIINGVSLLETKFGNEQPHHALVIELQSPAGQQMELGHRPRDAGAEAGPPAMTGFLAMKHRGEYRQHGFDHYPCIPSATRADLHVSGVPRLRMETRLGEKNRCVLK